MKRILLGCLAALCLASVTWAADDKKEAPATATAKEVAVIKFKDYGELVVEFWPEVAPKTVENFKKLAKDKFYDGTASHRLIPGFMLQMGDPLTKNPADQARWGTGDPGYKIKAEFNERKHVRGVLSMARSRNPDSAGSQFFVCFANASSLDNQYTTFGKVVKGEDVLAKLEKVKIEANPNSGELSKPVDRLHVDSIRIVDAATLK
jgi:peptidyl-prolyl cis-trans isomerase B (cyclophilin B)